MITVYTMIFNEEVFLQFMIDHYRFRFPNCHIIVYDNESTDRSFDIARQNNCEVISYPTAGLVDDDKLRNLKNNCWKSAKTDWVLVCDTDELLDITAEDLLVEEKNGSTLIKSECYNMVNMEDNFEFQNIVHGARYNAYDKTLLFNKRSINEINYMHGAHVCYPQGNIKYSEKGYNLYHYKYLNLDYAIERHKLTANRLSPINRAHGWGIQYLDPADRLVQDFAWMRTHVEKVR